MRGASIFKDRTPAVESTAEKRTSRRNMSATWSVTEFSARHDAPKF